MNFSAHHRSRHSHGNIIQFISILLLPFWAEAETHYVSSAGLHLAPFTNWVEAATNIQAAVNVCAPGEVVLVTNGVYSMSQLLTVSNGIRVESVNGPAATRIQVAHGGHGVYLLSGAVLQGLQIQGATNTKACGVRVNNGTIDNCWMISNYWGVSGGNDTAWNVLPAEVPTLRLYNSRLASNLNYGVFCPYFRDVIVTNCTISQNGSHGFRQYMDPVSNQLAATTNTLIDSCGFLDNASYGLSTVRYGPASFGVQQSAFARILNCEVAGNRGGIADNQGTGNDARAIEVIERCHIYNNLGRGLYISRHSAADTSGTVVKACSIHDNTFAGSGAGIYAANAGTIINGHIYRNAGTAYGGGAYLAGSAALYHCTLTDNSAYYGGGTYGGVIYNSIVFYNQGSSGSNYNASTFYYSCTAPPPSGSGNIISNPLVCGFSNPHITANSPCVSRGSYAYSRGETDLDGEPRIWGDGVEMGCDEIYPAGLTGTLTAAISQDYHRAVVNGPIRFESLVAGKVQGLSWDWGDGQGTDDLFRMPHAFAVAGEYAVVLSAWNNSGQIAVTSKVTIFNGYTNYASPSGGHAYPFTNWITAATTLQAAVDASIPGGVVRAADGVYDNGGQAISGNLASRLAVTNAITVWSLNGPAFTAIVGQGPPGTQAMRGVYLSGGAQLSGFTITGGATRADAMLSDPELSGGGVWCEGDAALSNCLMAGNNAFEDGGGVRGGRVYDSELRENTAGNGGGGAMGAMLTSCLVVGNQAGWDGGGLFACMGSNSVLRANQAGQYGGGAFSSTLRNSLVVSNRAALGGGTAYGVSLHCTIVQNAADSSGGGDYHGSNQNSILYYNTSPDAWPNYFSSLCPYTCTTPNPEAPGSLTQPPQFYDPAAGDYRLAADSPCLDAGSANALTRDLDGTPRPLDGTGRGAAGYDLGAYEHSRFMYASKTGSHSWPFTSWALAATTLQAAADAIRPDQTLLVTNGVYDADSRLIGGQAYRLAVSNPIPIQSMNGPAQTSIDGGGTMGCVYLGSGASLRGFTITNGFAAQPTNGISALCGEAGSSVSNCILSGHDGAVQSSVVWGGQLFHCLLAGNQQRLLVDSYAANCTLTLNTGSPLCDGSMLVNGLVVSNVGGLNNSTVSYTCLDFATPGPANLITNDPHLVDWSAADYRLAAGSPCIDAGLNNFPPGSATDLNGIPRPLDGRLAGQALVDMGAYEFLHPTADSDGDGLADTNELYGTRTNPAQRDTDGDLQGDGDELLAGTNPLDATNYFALLSFTNRAGSTFVMTWSSVTGRFYRVMVATNMASSWTNAPNYPETAGNGARMSYTNSVPDSPQFYGIKVRR